jgi:hypothetical protein
VNLRRCMFSIAGLHRLANLLLLSLLRLQVWQALLAVRSLVLPPSQDIATWLKFASLCRKSGRVSQSQATLVKLLQYDPAQDGGGRLTAEPPVMLAYLKHQWSLGGDRNRMDAFQQMQVRPQLQYKRSGSGVSMKFDGML